MAKKEAAPPAQRTAKPAGRNAITPTHTRRPHAKVNANRILPAAGQQQVTAADIPGTSDHARRVMRESKERDNPQPTRRPGIRVRALRPGYYGHSRRREGDVFTIRSEAQMGSWMERVDASTRESITTPNEVIRKKHDETLALKYGDRGAGAGHSPDDPADGEDDNPLGAD